MMSNIIKIFSIFYCLMLIYKKNTFLNLKSNIILPIFSLLLSIASFIVHYNYKELTYALPLLLFWIITSFITSSPQNCFAISIIAFGISFSIYSLISLILTLTLYPLFEAIDFPYTILAVLTCIFHITLVQNFLNIKRFKNGKFLLNTRNSVNIATIVGIFFIAFSMHIVSIGRSTYVQILALLSSCFILSFLIYWWQAQITKSYRRSLELRELESMRTEMAELKRSMQKLVDENERLSRITHRDNTLISALKNSTLKYLSTDFANPNVATEVRNQLIENINTLSADRNKFAENHTKQAAREFDTGLSLLDTLLQEMDTSAIAHKISFSVHLGTALDAFVPKDISESDLVHAIDDLLKNAFKATFTCEKRIVQLQFYKLGKHLVVEVADNGIPFEIESLVNMGIKKRTTYPDGSGIGLMDIWNTKEKYGATYHLEEYGYNAPFTKRISLTLDKKNRYSIRTWRKHEILQISKRVDLQIYDYFE